jgi:hypothetical protein
MVFLAHALLGPRNRDIVIAGKGLAPLLVVAGPLAQQLFADYRSTNDLPEEVRNLFRA